MGGELRISAKCAASKATRVRGERSTPLSSKSLSSSNKTSGMRRMYCPGLVLPVRPRRCFIEALEHHSVISIDILTSSLWTLTLCNPKSMTAPTPGTVSEDSAMFVASATLQTPSGAGSSTPWYVSSSRAECIKKTS
eukprot:CAMPEP_0115141468 /NCGR_PEP_ID=MMETSP0227-20121206/59555_1 /TAXON_ID=89957 /ORGANISM="Polarella glacialis, Strain CCMP 1383" /LENGTH=136 /DNA_ID=CAMNT_0002549835 /DNA_START=33 /DNA_END=440 /DNA_ORIENTATION=-